MSSNERLLVLANRNAGALARRRGDHPFVPYAQAAGLELEVVSTRNAEELQQTLRDRVLGKLSRVAVAGGDGTIHAAAQVLAHQDVALGILPLGTANNFATALRLPMDLPSAFRVIAEGEERAVSLGEAEGEYFTEAAGVGIFADALALCGSGAATKSIARTLVTAARLWVTHRPHHLELVVDGELQTEDAVMVAVANSFRLGLAVAIAPTARLTDRELDVVILGPLTRRELVSYFRAIRAQAHTLLPKVKLLRAKEITLRSRHPLNVHVDDRVRRRTPVTLRIAPGALRVMVDRL